MKACNPSLNKIACLFFWYDYKLTKKKNTLGKDTLVTSMASFNEENKTKSCLAPSTPLGSSNIKYWPISFNQNIYEVETHFLVE